MSNIKVYPNQMIMNVEKAICDKEHLYTTNNLQALDYAAGVLNANEFKLWLYIAKNQDKYGFAFSSKDFCQWAGNLGIQTYNRAMDKLKALKFVVPKEGTKNEWIFRDWGEQVIVGNGKKMSTPQVKSEQDLWIENKLGF